MKHRETPLSHVLLVMALGFALLVAINLLGCDREHDVIELDGNYPVEVPECVDRDDTTGVISSMPSVCYKTADPDREREILLRENEELHYNNMIRARIIEELMERVDKCEEKP